MWLTHPRAAGLALSATLALALTLAQAETAPSTDSRDSRDSHDAHDYHDGHTRPRALAYNPADGLLYVALSTADALAVVDPAPPRPRVLARVPVCRFPAALAPSPDGGVVAACRFEPGLRRVRREPDGVFRVTFVEAGPESGARGLALSPGGAVAYVASPARGGIAIVPLADGGRVAEVVPTGLSPRALRVVPAGTLPAQRQPLLLASSFIDHTVTVYPIAADGRLLPPVQTLKTDAPVLDMVVAAPSAPALWLLTHEDRPLSRARGSVEGLDSGVLRLAAAAPAAGTAGTAGAAPAPFVDPGPGRREFANTSERAPEAIVELAAAARDPDTGALALVGAGSDNLLLVPPRAAGLEGALAVSVGANPSAVAALPGGRWVTADRLSDTLTFVGGQGGAGAPAAVQATLSVGVAERPSPAERGELLFYSRALVPNNVADGPLSLYTCAACHDDGHVDGRRHPSKRNRFFSMTKTCRGLAITPPYLSLGEPDTIDAFADNIVATHAQGAERDAERFDKYPVTLTMRSASRVRTVVLSPAAVRASLAAYMTRIPTEPSPFVEQGRRELTAGERHGLGLFRGACSGCHELVTSTARGKPVPPSVLEARLLAGEVALTSPRLHDVGTPVLGKDGNNPPSLRGVWEAAPYFSDGSARTLEDVLRRTDPEAPHVHAPANATRPPAFTAEDRAALLAFLRAL